VVGRRLEATDRAATFIDRLQDEICRLKGREDEQKLKPLLTSLIKVADGLQDLLQDLIVERLDIKIYESVEVLRAQVVEELARNGALPFAPDIGDGFDAERHEALSLPLDPTSHKHPEVMRVLRPGFEFARRVLRPALVVVR
jgi:molecular chaperone GrpE (heat shock protein)